MKRTFPLILIILALIFGASCEKQPASPEDEIRQFINQGISAAEDRKASPLIDAISTEYQDERNRDKKQLGQMLRLLFLRHKSIYLFSKIDQITIHNSEEARVEMYIAMAGQVISDVTALTSLRARMYRLELDLVKEGDWLLQSASWEHASPRDMQ